jgi:D-xylose transport system permease protein
MTIAQTSSSDPAMQEEGAIKTFLRATEIDTRMLGMIGALVVIWLGFHLYGYFVNGFGASATSGTSRSRRRRSRSWRRAWC